MTDEGTPYLAKRSVLDREPVRVVIYSALTLGIAAGVAFGWINNEQSTLWGSLLAVALGIPATEVARSAVTPVRA